MGIYYLLLVAFLFQASSSNAGDPCVANLCANLPTGTVLPNPNTASGYIVCVGKNGIELNCPTGLCFDKATLCCSSNCASGSGCGSGGSSNPSNCATTAPPCNGHNNNNNNPPPCTTTAAPCNGHNNNNNNPPPCTTTAAPCNGHNNNNNNPPPCTTTAAPCNGHNNNNNNPPPCTTAAPCNGHNNPPPCTTTAAPCNGHNKPPPCTTNAPSCTTTVCGPQWGEFVGFYRRKKDARGQPDGSYMMKIDHCRLYYVIKKGKAIENNCPEGQWFDRNSVQCRDKRYVTCLANTD